MQIAELLIKHDAKLDKENSENISEPGKLKLHEIAKKHGLSLSK